MIDQQEGTETGASGDDLGAPLSLPAKGRWWYCLTAAVRSPGAAPPGVSIPCRYIPADANGGLCIGRSCADALGAWGPSATNKLRRVYTGALLATTINAYKRKLNVIRFCGILNS